LATLQIQTPEVFLPLLQPARYKGAWGGRGCVHPDTLIDTPSGQVKIKDFEGGEVYSHFEGRIVPSVATPPVEYPAEDLYKVTFGDGREIIVTDEHRFLTQRGWVQTRHLLGIDRVVCEPLEDAVYHPLSNSGISLSGLLLNARRYLERLSDCLDDYLPGFRQYDRQPLFLSDTGQASFPLRGDEQRHSHHVLKPSDAMEYENKHNLLQSSRRLPNSGVLHGSAGNNYEDWGNYIFATPSEQLLDLSPWLLRFHGKKIRPESSQGFSGFLPDLGFCKNLAQKWKKVFGILLSGVFDILHLRNPYKPLCSHNPLILNRIISVCKHSHQPYWDLHVPGYENYLSNGIVNHNSGKSFHFAEAVIERCLMNAGTRVVCVREVQRSLKESVKRLIDDKIVSMGVEGHFTSLTDSIKTPGDGVIIFQGMADHTADSIKSLEGFDIAYVEEAQSFSERSLELLRPTIRKPGSELWFSWNPRTDRDPVDMLLRGPNPPENSIVVKSNWMDNPFFPQVLEEERRFDYKHNPQRYGHIWDGEYEPQAIGAIWTKDIIDRNRKESAPEMGRVLVGIDPAISSEEQSNETGIITGGLSGEEGYVLADNSINGTPEQWGRAAVAAYDLYEADAIVAEVNQGGEMVEHVIHSIRPNIKVIKVRATRGKHVRAEPISSLYALNRIHHVGNFPELERQMCLVTAEGYEGTGSCDRVDAAVWVFAQLFNKMVNKKQKGPAPSKAVNSYNPHRWRRSG